MFWWNTGGEKSNINWMCWDRMAKHKSAGGMGFRNFRDFNVSMLGKQGWRIMTNPNSLVAKLYKARYFVNTDFLNASIGHNPSFIWRSILEARELLKEGI